MSNNCKNDSIQAMLVPYADGVLKNAGNRQTVEDHLKQCAECRQRLELIRKTLTSMETLAVSGYKPPMEPHLAPDLLFAFALERSRMNAQDLEKVKKHLRACLYCQNEIKALKAIDEDYQKRIITVGTSDVFRALKRSHEVSSSGSFECEAPTVPTVAPNPGFWDYWHQISLRINFPRAVAAGVVGLLLLYALSQTMCSDTTNSNTLENLADKTADAIATLPSPGASAISVTISLDAPEQNERLCYLLKQNGVPFEDIGGKVRIPADYAVKAQQIWAEAVERSHPEGSASDTEVSADAQPEVTYQEIVSEPVSAAAAQDAAVSDSWNSEAQQASSVADTAASVAEPSYSEPAAEKNVATADVAEPQVRRPVESAPKAILRPLHGKSEQKAVTSSAGVKEVYVPKSSASRPQPKPEIVAPTAAPVVSADAATEKEVSANDVPALPQIVRVGGAQPLQHSTGSSDAAETQAITPTPRSVYEGNSEDDGGESVVGSWSNET
ncbi:hypothetical protein IJT17_09970 [bacterium]|nr:hypothetical protein [bacterium]